MSTEDEVADSEDPQPAQAPQPKGRILVIDDSELVQWYANALALVYPSEYEGFGLPILEAMAAGTLVAASSTSSMPEVGGPVAFYFDPCSVESIAGALSPVPGGVGPLTIALLLKNTVRAAMLRC